MNIHQVEQLIRDLLAGKVDAAGYGKFERDGDDDEDDGERQDKDGETTKADENRWRRILIRCLLAVIAPSALYLATHLRNTIAWEAGSTALCRDSTFSRSHHRSGTCAWHHGVAARRYAATDTIWK